MGVSVVGPGRGAAVWVASGQLEKWVDHPWNQPRIPALTDDGGHRCVLALDRRPRAGESRWPLDSLAVHPGSQGLGYGSALVRAGVVRARTDGVGAHL